MDKIPLEDTNSKEDKKYLYGIELTKAEEANAEKINDLIGWCRDLQERLIILENK